MKSIKRFAAALALMFTALSATSASAAIITYDFTVIPETGPLSGEIYSGSFSYNDAVLTNSGVEFVNDANSGLSVSFTFEGTTYFASNDMGYPIYPVVNFFNGELVGLRLAVDNLFSIGSASDFEFGGSDFEYAGSEPFLTLDAVTYTLRTEDPGQGIPEPATLALLGAGLAGLGVARRRKSRA